jgi:acid phosphatase
MNIGYTRRDFVRVLFASAPGMLVSRGLASDFVAPGLPGSLNFVMIGDWGRRGEQDQVEVANQMAKAAAEIGAKFVISVGDNFYEDGVDSTTDEHWKVSFEEVYAQPSLQVPWAVILGNHDYHGNCQAQLDYHAVNSRWRMPARYFKEFHQVPDGTTAEFFYLDTSPFVKSYLKNEKMVANIQSQNVPRQIAWLKKSLEGSQADWKIVIGHHPIYTAGGHGDTQELIEEVLPLLHTYKVQAYFCGHDHNLQHLVDQDVNMFVTGGGSQHTPILVSPFARFGRPSSGFIAVSLGGRSLDVRFIDNAGTVLYTKSVSRVSA